MSDTDTSSLNRNAPQFVPSGTDTESKTNVQYIYFQPITEDNWTGHQSSSANLCPKPDTELGGVHHPNSEAAAP